MRRRWIPVALIAAAVLIAWGVLRAVLPAAGVSVPGITPGHSDYRDPVQLAQAMKAREHSDTASCARNTYTGTYMCFVYFLGGTSGAYTVTVSPDGKSFTAS
jgi:hypothetical protein